MSNQSRTSRRSVLAALGAVPVVAAGAPLVAAPAAHADSAGHVPDELRPGGEFDRYLAGLAAEGVFSGTVLVSHRNRTVLSRSHGMADRARSIPNGPDTIFVLGSITKLFTGFAITKLVQDGKVSFTGKVGDYLDGFPPEVASSVTVHHLLTMSSGLGDYHSPEYFEAARGWDTVEEVWEGTLGFVRKGVPAFPPGSGNTYSNAGFVILGAIVARASGKSYYDYVREHVFARAGMADADFYTMPQWRANRRMAHPYAAQASGERRDALDAHGFVGLPPGGSQASAPDLVRFAHAWQRNVLLDPAFTYILSSPKLPMGRSGRFEGYSTAVELIGGQWVTGHNGGAPGVSCNLDVFADSGWVAVVLANYDRFGTPMGPASEVSRKLRELITRTALSRPGS